MSGITTNTMNNLVLDAGTLYMNYDESDERVLSATQEGASFVVEQTLRNVPIDGLRGQLKGTRRLVEENARITANILELTPANLKMILAGSTITSESDYEAITRSVSVIPDADYITNIALVGTLSGYDTPIVFIIKNALADGNFTLETSDQNEANPEVQFTAHYNPSSPDKCPWEIRRPAIT